MSKEEQILSSSSSIKYIEIEIEIEIENNAWNYWKVVVLVKGFELNNEVEYDLLRVCFGPLHLWNPAYTTWELSESIPPSLDGENILNPVSFAWYWRRDRDYAYDLVYRLDI